MQLDNSKNSYVLYYLDGKTTFNGVDFQSVGSRDILLIKYNSDGDMLWWRQIGGPTSSSAVDLAVGPTNDVFITGTLNDDCDVLGLPFYKSLSRSFVARIDPSGAIVWMNQITSPSTGSPFAIAVNKNNVVLVSGMIDYSNQFMTAWTSSGTPQWTHIMPIFGCCTGGAFGEVAAGPDGNFIVSASFLASISFPEPVGIINSNHFWSLFIIKISPAGEMLWGDHIDVRESFAEIGVSRVKVDEMSNIFVLGFYRNTLVIDDLELKQKNTEEGRVGFLLKMDASANAEWVRGIFSFDAIPDDVDINSQKGEICIATRGGNYFNYNDEFFIPGLSQKSLLVTTDLEGKFKRAMYLGEETFPTFSHEVAFGDNNEIFVTGNYSGDLKVGCAELEDGYYGSSFFLKLGDIPERSIDHVDDVCDNSTLRVHLSGADNATKYVWRCTFGVSPVNHELETTEPYIDLLLENVDSAYVHVIPYFDCHARTEYSTFFRTDPLPAQPDKPIGSTILCQNDVTTYSVSPVDGVDDYEWIISGGLQLLNSVSNQVTVKAGGGSGTGVVKVLMRNGCGATDPSDSLVVQLRSLPQPPAINGPDSICTFRDSEFRASSPDAEKYRWRYSSGMFPKTSNTDSSFVRFYSNVTILHSISVASVGYCGISAATTIDVRVLTGPDPITIDGENAICVDDDEVTFTITPQQEGKVTWDFPSAFIKTNESDFSISLSTNTTAATGNIIASIENVCASVSSSKTIAVVRPPSKPFIRIDDCNKTITYTGHELIKWYKDDALLNSSSNSLAVPGAGVYHVEVQSACGSVSSNEIIADPISLSTAFFPNVVTSHAEGKNDVFIVDDGLKGSSLSIFNRSGILVFDSPNYRNTWNGEELPAGIYYYVLKNECLDEPVRGVIHLMK